MGKNKLDKQGRPKKPFYQTWLPWKGDRPSQVILKLLTLVMLVVFLGAAGYLVNELVILPMQADQVVSEIQDVFYETEEPSSSESSESADRPRSRSWQRNAAASHALDMVRRYLQNLGGLEG